MTSNSAGGSKQESSRTLTLIGIFKVFKAVTLIATGVGMLRLLNKDLEEVANQWVAMLNLNPQNRFVDEALGKFLRIDNKQLAEFSIVSFVYAAIFLIEGTGLLLRKRWAEYLTILSTGLLLPLEIYELVKKATWGKGAVLMVNAAIVAYLIYHVRAKTNRTESPGTAK